MTYAEARAQFPVLERLAYLRRAASGHSRAERPRRCRCGRGEPSTTVAAESRSFTRLLEAREELPRRDRHARRRLGRHGRPDCLDDRRLELALAGLDLRGGDEVITTTDEHFGLIGPLHASGARSSSPSPSPSGSSRRSRRGRGSSRSRTSSRRRAPCSQCTSSRRPPGCRSSSTKRSRSESPR